MKAHRLRTRIIILFAGGALLLSTGLALTAYQVTRHNLLSERERTAVRAAFFDAAVVRPSVVGDDDDVLGALRSLDTGQGRRPLVRKAGAWYSRSADDGLTRSVPAAMLASVEAGEPAVQRVRLSGRPALVVGVPFRGEDAAFYEIQSLVETQATLRTLAGTLAGAAVAATAAAAGLSVWVARRALRPLQAVAATAELVGTGDLTARMPPSDDPDLQALTRSFNAMVTELGGQMERERRFAADVSHELRSPLQTLASASQVLLNQVGSLDSRAAQAAHLVTLEVERFNQLVQVLLDLSRADQPLQVARADIIAVAEGALQRRGADTDLVHADAQPLYWPVDVARLQQVLDNLLANANKHGGGVTAVGLSQDALGLVIEVDDAGPGIPPEERELVLDRFGRGRTANVRDGADGFGLGLSLVSEHIRAHGGTVAVLDRPGGGCRVRVTIPRTAS